MRGALRLPDSLTLRFKFLSIVLGVALAPLAIAGFWLMHGTERSGERLLQARLDSALARIASDVGSRWVRERSALLTIADGGEVRRSLASDPGTAAQIVPITNIAGVLDVLNRDVELVLLRDVAQRPRWVLAILVDSEPPRLVPAGDSARFSRGDGTGISIVLPLFDAQSSAPVGSLEVRLRASAIVESGAANAAGAGAVLAVVDRASGASVLPLPFDPSLLASERFMWTGEEWLRARRELDEPPITLIAAAPIAPFSAPFKQTARVGTLLLAGIAFGAFVVTLLLTSQTTGSLERLASAADAVSRGDLDQHVDATGRDEIGRVAFAFNAMTESLRRTLRQLSQHEAVAAVGELASTLAHEVRNPLSGIKLRLQHLREQLDGESSESKSVSLALLDVERLERTVAGTLRIAQSGRLEMEPVSLESPLEAAARSTAPEFSSRGAVLEALPDCLGALRVRGNAAALEQLFLNLLLNAAQSLDEGGRGGVRVSTESNVHIVTVWDTGRGIGGEELRRAFQPFFSTKPGGTGLGLAIVKRIVDAHGGRVDIDSTVGVGTCVRVALPRFRDESTTQGVGMTHDA